MLRKLNHYIVVNILFCRKCYLMSKLIMVFGLQHIITENNYAFNIQVTVLPFEDNGRTDVYEGLA